MESVWQFLHDTWQTLRHGGFPDLGWWSYLLLIFLAATEGPLSVLLGAAAASAGYLEPAYVYLAAVTGNLLGDTVWYLVGYSNKTDRLFHFGGYFGMHPEHIVKLKVAIRRHAAKLILLAKLSVSLMIPTLVAAGLARVPWRRWFPVVFVVEMVWTALLVWVGYHAAYLISSLERWLALIGVVFVIVLIVSVVRYVRRLIQREEEENPPAFVEQPQPQSQPQPRSLERPPSDQQRLHITLDREHRELLLSRTKQH
ncbi:MAG TPA: VTT domain-containing protein [Caldilineaceae bacterium]|nr:VTT domain-containing protein [Caldilineaceae bacterium]